MAPTLTPTQPRLYIEGYLQQNNLEHLVMFFVKMLNSQTLEELGTHQKTISRIPEQMYSPSETGLGMAWRGSLFMSVSNKHRGAKMRILFKSFPRPLLKSSIGPLARYSNHQEIVNRRPEQMYTSFDTRLEWPREKSLFELGLNKRRDPKQGHYSSQLLGHY